MRFQREIVISIYFPIRIFDVLLKKTIRKVACLSYLQHKIDVNWTVLL